MIKKCFLLISLIFTTKLFPGQDIDTLKKMFSDLSLHRKLDEDSKKRFNDFVKTNEANSLIFDAKKKTFQDHDYSHIYLKNFDFTQAILIHANLQNAVLTDTIFDHTTFQDIDFQQTDLKWVKFKNCKFIRCNLKNVDLSETNLEGCKFKKVKLDGAYLGHDVTFNGRMPHIKLVRLYEEFIKKGEPKKAKALNKIFGVLKLKLEEADLSNMNLLDIDLHKADLQHAKLQGVRLSNHLVLPDYNKDEELVYLYAEFIKKEAEKNAKILNSIFKGLGLYFYSTNLSNLNLTGINLSFATLEDVDLTNTNLTGANLKYTKLHTDKLKGVKFSDTFTLQFNDISELYYKWKEEGPNQQFYQILINANLPLFTNIPYECLKENNWKGLDLRNANFDEIKLKNFDFTGANLKSALFVGNNLKGSTFTNTNLKKAELYEIDFSNAKLINANFNKTQTISDCSNEINFNNADLTGVNLKKTNLRNASFKGTLLEKDLQINYNDDISELFKEWAKNDVHRPLYQKLINAYVKIFFDIPKKDLQNTSWEDLNFNNADMSFCKFSQICFKNINFKNTEFSNTTFKYCYFKNVNFKNSILDNPYSDSDDICFQDCYFDNVSFKNCSYNTKCFESCHFFNISFKEIPMCNFDQCEFDNFKIKSLVSSWDDQKIPIYSIKLFKKYSKCKDSKTLFNHCLRHSTIDLRGADLRGLNLKGIYLVDANLENANLQGTDLEEADLRGANLNGAKLSMDDLSKDQWLNVKLVNDFTIIQEYFEFDRAYLIRVLQSKGMIITQPETQEPSHKKIKIEQ